jgi:dTDP-4-amino-4,6-dideoxygalactose transaminase
VEVPFFDMARELAPIRSEIDAAIARVLDSGVFIGGEEVTRFERALAGAAGTRYAIGTSSGTDALVAVLMAHGIGPQHEVVTTPFTFFATAGAIARLGARVVFADVHPNTWTLDPRATATACSPRTAAVVPVHLFGRRAARLEVPCPVIDDAAQALGAGPPMGIAAAISFFPTKNLGAIGDAGAVVTDDEELATRVRLIRGQGAARRYHHEVIGANFRLDALQAAVLSVKLGHLARWTALRRAHAARYRSLITAARMPDELALPPESPEHVYHQFVIAAPRRDALREHLARAGIGTEVYYPQPLHLQPCFAHLGYRRGALPHAESASERALALPIHPALSADAQSHVVDEIAHFYRQP